MLKAYKIHYKFTLEGMEEDWYKSSDIFLEEESKANKEIQKFEGQTFQSFWDLHNEFGLILPSNRWNRALWSKKRRIEFFFDLAPTWVDNGKEERKWTLEIVWGEPEMTMKQLFELPAEKVIQYLKERGIDKI